ncbi:MAG: ABC transporter permease [Candidatus Eisenbacteria bacterium]|nr:ABC transporter permease [Candidatus Eisenbacteria bacterium]MCC7143165.1 ABC transporter permease [Candidatus Eisenbacteria bacterium]
MRKILAVAWKELRQASRDPITLGMLIGVPAIMLLLYGYALSFDVRHVALAVQDLDQSRASRELVSSFINSTFFDRTLDLAPGAQAEDILERREAKAVLVIPAGLARDLAAGRTASIQFLADGTDSQTANTILGYAAALTASANVELAGRSLSRGSPPIDYRPRVWYNPELRSTHFLVPGLIGFILMLTAVLSTALSIVRERERGTMEQLRVTPLGAGQLVIGKTIPYLGISLLASVVILVAADLLFGVRVKGSYFDLFIVTLVYLIGALGFGLLVSSLVDSQALAFQVGTTLSMLPAIFLSGFIFPLRSMPLPLQGITHLVPARYFLVMSRGIILKGAPLTDYLDTFAFLCLYSFAVFAFSWLRLTRKEG